MENKRKIKLVLENGIEFEGYSFGAEKPTAGEVVFDTAMTGYPESLTDPSYKGHILVYTYPLIGNYGVPGEDIENNLYKYYESYAMHISGLIVSDYSEYYSHWNAKMSLADWLKKFNVPGITGIDTRKLTKILREEGTMLGKIIFENNSEIDFFDPNKENMVKLVSTKEKKLISNGKYTIILIDCGTKFNIARNLIKRNASVIIVPWDYDFTKDEYDGVFISNGPGDPEFCNVTINNIRKAFDKEKPICGICLGNQLLGLAAGAKTYKLKYGHRSHNQPVIKCGSNKALITSQNHGYTIDNNTLPNDWETLFINLNDKTNEGIKHKKKPFFSSQFHPEAFGGPTDTEFIFDDFMDLVAKYKGN